MGNFKIGDRVKITYKDFILDNQNEMIGNGIIAKIEDEGSDMPSYTFQNGYRNSYRDDHLELIKMDKNKLQIGSKVKFVDLRKYYDDGKELPMVVGWNVIDIPDKFIWHGKTTLHDDYNKEFALIVDMWDSPDSGSHYNIVEYKDSTGKKVRLGFLDSSLELVISIKFKVGDKVKVLSKTVPEHNEFAHNMKQNEIGYINKIYGDPCIFNDEENCFVVGKLNLDDEGNLFALKDLELIESGIVIGTKVKISVPRNHPDWSYDGKLCTIKNVSYFWDDPKTTKELYIVDLEDKRFMRGELELLE